MAPAIHATAIAIDGIGILLLGPSGSGKSDLALRLIDRGADLIGDDYCRIVEQDGAPQVQNVERLAGKIEVRGVGIIQRPYAASAPLRLALLLDKPPERLPDEALQLPINDWMLPAFPFNPFEASATLKAELLLRRVVDAGQYPVRWHAAGSQQGVN